LAAVKAVVTTNDYSFFKGDAADKALTKQLAEELAQFGIQINSVQLSDFTESLMLAHWGLGGSENG
jgi:NAD(P)-dependent dehydrogenase (short-subunit alcohol dehydrogenase family)